MQQVVRVFQPSRVGQLVTGVVMGGYGVVMVCFEWLRVVMSGLGWFDVIIGGTGVETVGCW